MDKILAVPLATVARTCGWNVLQVEDGNDVTNLLGAFAQVPTFGTAPCLIIANTIKGKGVSYMEGEAQWHACWPDVEHEKKALEELAVSEVD